VFSEDRILLNLKLRAEYGKKYFFDVAWKPGPAGRTLRRPEGPPDRDIRGRNEVLTGSKIRDLRGRSLRENRRAQMLSWMPFGTGLAGAKRSGQQPRQNAPRDLRSGIPWPVSLGALPLRRHCRHSVLRLVEEFLEAVKRRLAGIRPRAFHPGELPA